MPAAVFNTYCGLLYQDTDGLAGGEMNLALGDPANPCDTLKWDTSRLNEVWKRHVCRGRPGCVYVYVCVLPSLQLCIDLQLWSDASSGQLKVFLMDWTGQYNQSACLDCRENRSPGRAAVYHRKVRKGAAWLANLIKSTKHISAVERRRYGDIIIKDKAIHPLSLQIHFQWYILMT